MAGGVSYSQEIIRVIRRLFIVAFLCCIVTGFVSAETLAPVATGENAGSEPNEQKLPPTEKPVVKPPKSTGEKLTILGRVQMRAMSGQADTFWSTPGNDYSFVDFNFRRLRLGIIYDDEDEWGAIVHMRLENALNRAYLVQTKNSTGEVTNVALHDNRGLIQEANLWYNFNFMQTRVVFGMIGVPFSREYLTSSANLINIERSMTTNAAQQFDNGLMLQIHPMGNILGQKYARLIQVSGMIGTGHGGNGDFGFGRRFDTAQSQGAAFVPVSPFFYGRLQWNAIDPSRGQQKVVIKEGEEIFVNEPRLSLGYGIMGTNETKITNNGSFETTPRVSAVASANPNFPLLLGTDAAGTSCAATSRPSGVNCSLLGHTIDLAYSQNRIFLNATYNFYAGLAGQNITGYTITLGYNLPISAVSYLMPVVRYDFMKGNFNTFNSSGLSSDPANQISMVWLGLNLFADRHLFKLQLFFALHENRLRGYDALGGASLGGYRQNLFIFQAQASFWTGTAIAQKPTHVDL